MAIFSLNHRAVGKTTHVPRTAGCHIRYITRPEAATRVLGERMPIQPNAARAWMDAQEDGDRKNARVIDKVMVALPLELTHGQRAELVQAFAEAMSQGRASWIAAIHDGRDDADNPHAHIVFRDRDFETAKRVIQLSEKGSTERLRIAWEEHANRALERAGLDVRIDRRSLEARGVDREAGIHVGPNARVLEKQGRRPESLPREVLRFVEGGLKPIVIDYPSIDGGKTRHEENEERRARNVERTRNGGAERDWTDHAGMVAQQRSAMKWVKHTHSQRKGDGKQGVTAWEAAHGVAHGRDCVEPSKLGHRGAETTDRTQVGNGQGRRSDVADAMRRQDQFNREGEQSAGRDPER
jgi:hypothetical protein